MFSSMPRPKALVRVKRGGDVIYVYDVSVLERVLGSNVGAEKTALLEERLASLEKQVSSLAGLVEELAEKVKALERGLEKRLEEPGGAEARRRRRVKVIDVRKKKIRSPKRFAAYLRRQGYLVEELREVLEGKGRDALRELPEELREDAETLHSLGLIYYSVNKGEWVIAIEEEPPREEKYFVAGKAEAEKYRRRSGWVVEPVLGSEEFLVVDREFLDKVLRKVREGKKLTRREEAFVDFLEKHGFATRTEQGIDIYITA